MYRNRMEEEDEERRVLAEVFGYSSSSDADADADESPSSPILELHQHSSLFHPPPGWVRVDGVKGLWLHRGFLDPDQQSRLLSSIIAEKWFADSAHNQAMRFGCLPEWADLLSSYICELCPCDEILTSDGSTSRDRYSPDDCPLAMDLLWREPLFNQLITNVYRPGEGICAHVDLMRFEDGIAIVSLESSCVMHFTRVDDEQGIVPTKIPVLLTPGSLCLMSGEARYLWKHEINRKPGFQVWDGKELMQGRRTSITLRRLCQVHPDSVSNMEH